MTLTTLDIIIRRNLMELGLPIHYYFEGLLHASACLRELTIDTLHVINTVQLAVDELGNVDLPSDCADVVAVSFDNGSIRPIPQQDYISPIRVHNGTTGDYELQPSSDVNGAEFSLAGFFYSTAFTWFWNTSAWGEPTGRNFGSNGGTSIGYKVIREQRRIQMSSHFCGGGIVLMYISDGQNVDNASQIDVRAQNCIQKWINWKMSPNAINDYSAEGVSFYKSKKNLKARMNNLDIATIRNILHRSYTATIKN